MFLLWAHARQLFIKQISLPLSVGQSVRILRIVDIGDAGGVWPGAGDLGQQRRRSLVLSELIDVLLKIFIVLLDFSSTLHKLFLLVDCPLFNLSDASIIGAWRDSSLFQVTSQFFLSIAALRVNSSLDFCQDGILLGIGGGRGRPDRSASGRIVTTVGL